MASFKVDVAPAVLAWARRTAHLSKEEVARKLAPKEDKIGAWLERVRAWEDGDDKPTYAQLRAVADLYRRPLTALLLAEPPDEPDEVQDFRRPSELGEQPPALAFALREARERRDIAAELLEATRSSEPQWSVTVRLTDDPEDVGATLRQHLGVSLEQQGRGLSVWRAAIEAAGVLVFGFAGVDSRLASGFSLASGAVPVIALNNADAPTRRTFTLLHELAHVALRSGETLCDLTDEGPHRSVESFCNHVAGAVLVPREALLEDPLVRRSTSQTWPAAAVSKIATRFGVSREVIIRRLLLCGRTTREHYAAWRGWFRKEQEEYEAKLARGTGGPTHHRRVVSQLGRRYTRLVLDAAEREVISLSDASSFLGVKATQFDKLAAELRGEAA